MAAHYSGTQVNSGGMNVDELWRYAEINYARPGVAAACLRLQDECGADVNLLLTAAWLASRGLVWDASAVDALIVGCAAWQSEVIAPLRSARRRFKAGQPAFYAAAQTLELSAEQVQLRYLQSELQIRSGRADGISAAKSGGGSNALTANLATYRACHENVAGAASSDISGEGEKRAAGREREQNPWQLLLHALK